LKDKIVRFSKGEFEYDPPHILLSQEEIRINIEAGKVYEGDFTIRNSCRREMKGQVHSTIRLLRFKASSFRGADNTVSYSFDASYLKAGEILQGEISIVSDCGEKLLPLYIEVEAAYVMTSLGKIKDLFQFTNLARTDWSEAKKVFRREDFERIFLANEERYRCLYRYLLKSISTSQALEEFLIAIHKKSRIQIKIDKVRTEYEVTSEEIDDHLTLSKDHWGYAEIRISTDVPFIKPEQKLIWADRFIDNSYMVNYTIDPKSLGHGNNYGHIYIKTAYQTITVDILCRYKGKEHRSSGIRLRQRLEFRLMENYLNLRLNRISLDQYISEIEAILQEYPVRSSSSFIELIRIHQAIISGKMKMAKELLEDLGMAESGIKQRQAFEYCAFLYLQALYDKNEDTIKSSAEKIRFYYENKDHDWRILWFLLNTDLSYQKNRANKLKDIREQFTRGCHSPILYYEAVCIYNEEPVLLRGLGNFEIQVLNYGIKNDLLGKELVQQYSYIAGKSKTFHPILFRGLTTLYDKYEDTAILSAICCILIKGLKKAEKYFPWYRLGVEAQLRITELYEYYMYSISEERKEPIEQAVLLYFIYNSSLNDRKKALLYANIVRNKDKLEAIYRSYYKRMEVFASKMLEAHIINKDLAELYKEFIPQPASEPLYGKHLPYVMYRHEIICDNPNIVNATVVHKELGSEESHNLVQGRAQVDVFTSNAVIILTDYNGNRYAGSIDYQLVPYLNEEDYENYCLEHSDHRMLLLHLFDRCQYYRIMSESSIELRKRVLQIKDLTKEYITDCYQALIEYYYDNYNDELLEYYLKQIDLHSLKPADRSKYMEYMVMRSLYDKALDSLKIFGYEGVPVNRLLKMCSSWLHSSRNTADEEKQEQLVALCYYVFCLGKYDEAILRYLIRYYEGSTKEMFLLWKAAKSFELDTHRLEERLLIQMLFSESYLEESSRVFCDYYKGAHNHILVRAFLTYYAYNYLVHLHVIHPDLFPIMKRELNYEENDICLLAWLKHNTQNKSLADNELSFIEYHICRFVQKGIILPFFADYNKRIQLPDAVQNQCFITYITDPKNQVYIHYRLLKQKNQDYITERMPNAFMGIHVKKLMLFYHEMVQYYITEETTEGTSITESSYIQYDCVTPEEEDGKLNSINLMLMALEMKDDSTLLNLMENYAITEAMINTCFETIL
jgi:hypothetical protein